ncbi:MAG: DUF4159 domain-containing protein [Fidelibacterota bacterium]
MNTVSQFLIIGISLLNFTLAQSAEKIGGFSITRLHYNGGGDWYSDPSSLPNLLDYISNTTSISVNQIENRAQIGDDTFFESTYLYLTGHGNVLFTDEEAQILREHLLNGAFLHADDNYGMDNSFRREMRKVFPEKDWVEIPPTYEIFNIYYKFPEGIPKVHEHDGKRPQALGLFEDEKLLVLYTYESDLGDGWEDENVHNDPPEIRESALKMGTNIVLYALSR